jgi:hypothetical protein
LILKKNKRWNNPMKGLRKIRRGTTPNQSSFLTKMVRFSGIQMSLTIKKSRTLKKNNPNLPKKDKILNPNKKKNQNIPLKLMDKRLK